MDFYRDLSKYYEDIFPLMEDKLTLLQKYLPTGGSLLDIGCSTGEMAIQLAAKGYRVKGMDLSEEMIQEAREIAAQKGVQVDFQVGDMRCIEEMYSEKFSAISCFGNTIVHLNRLVEIKEFFQQVYDLLDSDGHFIFQIVNYDRILNQGITQLPLIENEEKGITFYRDYRYDKNTGLLDFNTRLLVSGAEEIEHSITLYPLQSHEIKMLLTTVGFESFELLGSFKGAEFAADSSMPLIGVAQVDK